MLYVEKLVVSGKCLACTRMQYDNFQKRRFSPFQ